MSASPDTLSPRAVPEAALPALASLALAPTDPHASSASPDGLPADGEVNVYVRGATGPAAPPVAAVASATLRFARAARYRVRPHTLVIGAHDPGLDALAAAVGATADGGPTGALHILCRLRDVEAVDAVTRDGGAVSYGRGGAAAIASPGGGRSALTAALGGGRGPQSRPKSAATPPPAPRPPACDSATPVKLAAQASPGGTITVRGTVLGEGAPLPASRPASPAPPADGDADPVLHLVVRRGARLALTRAPRGGFELRVCASLAGTAGALAAAAAAAAGEPLPRAGSSHRLLLDGCELPPDEPLAAAGVRPGAVLELVPADAATPTPAPPPRPHSLTPPLASPSLASPLHSLHAPWLAARAGLARGRLPELARAGSGGTYLLHDAAGAPVAVFKPVDEEPAGPCCPKADASALGGRSALSNSPGGGGGSDAPGGGRGVLPGEGAVREVAAYILDAGFAGVPPTAMVDLEQVVPGAAPGDKPRVVVRRGSLQAYVRHAGDAEEIGPARFAVTDVHRIAVIDTRLANTDRNAGNVLVVERESEGGDGAAAAAEPDPTGAPSPYRLVPIDHAYILPSSLSDLHFEWQHWRQARLPLDEAAAAYVASLDASSDLDTLAAAGIRLRPACETTLKLTTAFLQAAVAAGWTPAAWAAAATRPTAGERSALERLAAVARGRAAADAGVGKGAVPDDALLAAFRPLLAEFFAG
jgi:hypothetical protein